MGEDFGFWQFCSSRHFPGLNCLRIPHEFELGKQNIVNSTVHPENERHFSVPFSTTPENLMLKSPYGNDLGLRRPCLPQRIWTPTPKCTGVYPCDSSQIGEANPGQRRFLVFDQSGNRTSLIFSSIGPNIPIPHAPSQACTDADHVENLPPADRSIPVLHSIKGEDCEWLDVKPELACRDPESEMHEDTEELDALLYSDDPKDSNDCVEDEEASTGNSPDKMMTPGDGNEVMCDRAEVASLTTPHVNATNRRRRVEHDPALMDTASSGKDGGAYLEGNAGSSCVRDSDYGYSVGLSSPPASSSKRLRKTRIRETVGVLRSIIPGGQESDDPIAILDGAIKYLKSMRQKALAIGPAAGFLGSSCSGGGLDGVIEW